MSKLPKAIDSSNPAALVTVKTYTTETAAEVAASCLEANGIACMLSADDCGGMLSAMDNYSGVKLTVAANDAESAQEILSREGVTQPAPPENEPDKRA
jgi:hypothetical protein